MDMKTKNSKQGK